MSDADLRSEFEECWKRYGEADVSANDGPPDLRAFVVKRDIINSKTLHRLIEIDQAYRAEHRCSLTDEYYIDIRSRSNTLCDAGTRLPAAGRTAPSSDGELPKLKCPNCRKLTLLVAHDADGFCCAHPDCGATFELKPSTEHVLASVSHYEIVGLLGQGGFGRVWLAKDELNKEYVALKTPRSKLDDDVARRFVREMRYSMELTNESLTKGRIPRLLNAGRDGDVSFVAFEFVNAVPLSEMIGGRPMAPKKAASIVKRLASTLQLAHNSGIVHRDIKPANILMAGDNPYLTDFGIAKFKKNPLGVHAEADTSSNTAAFIGTFNYASPEQGDSEIFDERSDIFSLGIVFFELLAGQRPFQGEKSPLETYLLIANRDEPAPSVSDFVPGIPPELDQIVAKCLAKSPEDRFQSAGHLDRALASFLGQTVNVLEDLPSAPTSPDHLEGRLTENPPDETIPKSYRRFAAAVGATLLVLLPIGLWLGGYFNIRSGASDVSLGNGDSMSLAELDAENPVVGHTEMTDEKLKRLAREKGNDINVLKIASSPELTVEGLRELENFSNLERVELTGPMVLEAVDGSPVLTFADIANLNLDCDLKLTITTNEEETAAGLARKGVSEFLSGPHRSQGRSVDVSVAKNKVSRYRLLAFAGIDAQGFLSFVDNFEDPAGVDELQFWSTDVTGEALSRIAEFCNATRVRFDHSRLHSSQPETRGLGKLKLPPKVDTIIFRQNGLTDDDLAVLQLPNSVQHLDFDNEPSTGSNQNVFVGSGFASLAIQVPDLEQLKLNNIATLEHQYLQPWMKLAKLTWVSTPTWKLSQLSSPYLKVELKGDDVTDEDCMALAEGTGKRIESIEFRGCTGLTGKGLSALSKCTNLTTVQLTNIGIALDENETQKTFQAKQIETLFDHNKPLSLRTVKNLVIDEANREIGPDGKRCWNYATKLVEEIQHSDVESLRVTARELGGTNYTVLKFKGEHFKKEGSENDDQRFLDMVEGLGPVVADVDQLWIFKAEIGADSLAQLQQFRNADAIRLHYCRFWKREDDPTSALSSLLLPKKKLGALEIGTCGIADYDLAAIQLPKTVNKLSIRCEVKADPWPRNEDTGDLLPEILKRYPNLRNLELYGNPNLDLSFLTDLVSSNQLDRLYLGEFTADFPGKIGLEQIADLWRLGAPSKTGGNNSPLLLKIGRLQPELVEQIAAEDFQSMIDEVCSKEFSTDGRKNVIRALGERAKVALTFKTQSGTEEEKSIADELLKTF